MSVHLSLFAHLLTYKASHNKTYLEMLALNDLLYNFVSSIGLRKPIEVCRVTALDALREVLQCHQFSYKLLTLTVISALCFSRPHLQHGHTVYATYMHLG